jgi:hypothetical protein
LWWLKTMMRPSMKDRMLHRQKSLLHPLCAAARKRQDDCVFRGHPASDSESIRPPIPISSGH